MRLEMLMRNLRAYLLMARALSAQGVNPINYLRQAKAIAIAIQEERANPSDANVLAFPIQEFEEVTDEYVEEEEEVTMTIDNVIVMERPVVDDDSDITMFNMAA